MSGVKLGRAGTDEWRGTEGGLGVGERAAGVIYLTSWCACTNRMQQIIGNITSKTELFHNIL